MAEPSRIRIKRAYEPPERGDGVRILVDRLWPRGLRKDDAHFDEWRKDLSPSTALRQFYGHRPERFDEFTEAIPRRASSQGCGHGGSRDHQDDATASRNVAHRLTRPGPLRSRRARKSSALDLGSVVAMMLDPRLTSGRRG